MHKNSILDSISLQLDGERKLFDWRTYWYILLRRKWLVILPTILVSLVGLYVALSIVPMYESSTTILVSRSKLLTRSVRSVIPGVSEPEEISTAKRYILSSACLAQLINTLGLKREPELHKNAVKLSAQFPDLSIHEIEDMLFIDKVRKNISVITQGRDIIQISAKHKDPHIAYLFAKTLAQVFIDESQKRHLGGIRDVREFSEEQLAIYKDKLHVSEEKLKQFKQNILRNQIDDLESGQASLNRLKTDVAAMNVSIEDKKGQLASLKSTLSPLHVPRKIITNSKISRLKRDLFSKVDELMDILKRFTWQDLRVIALNKNINKYRDLIGEEVTRYVTANFGDKNVNFRNALVTWNMISLELDVLNYEKNSLSAIVKKVEKSLTKGPSFEMQLDRLQQEVEQNRQIYLNFLKQSRGTQIEEEIQRKDAEFKLQIIEKAKKPLYPTGKSRKLVLAMFMFAGLGLGAGVVYLLEYLDQSVKDLDEFEKSFKLPVWGVLPDLKELNVSIWRRDGIAFLLVFFGTTIAATLIFIFKK
ncbi:MAG: GumC family protein [bacterium]